MFRWLLLSGWFVRGVLCCGMLSLSFSIRAELPSPRLDRLAPLGLAAGQTGEFSIVGRDLEDARELWFDHAGLTAEFVAEGRFRIRAAADVPEGTYDVRAVGRFGVSSPRLVSITHNLTDVLEKDPNDDFTTAQPVGMNSSIHGSSDGNAQDLYSFTLKQGERVTIDCQATRLDSPMDATLALFTKAGAPLVSNGDYFGRDPFIDFIAPTDGEYVVSVQDLSYRGGFPYQLLITNRPSIENVFPRAVQTGQSASLVALGRNLTGHGGTRSELTEGNIPLDQFAFVLPPQSARDTLPFLEHPTHHSVVPTAATCTLDGVQVRVPIGGGAVLPSWVVLSKGPVGLDQEPNDDREHPQPLALPAMISGRLDRPRDADWYEVNPGFDGPMVVEVFCERIAGRADPYVSLVDEKGQSLGEQDDFGHRINAFDGHLRDPVGTYNVRKDQKYRLLVRDRYGRGGPRYHYVLAVRAPDPAFQIAAIHSENPGPAGLNLYRGGADYLDLIVHQQDGFNEVITVTAEGLPDKVHASPVVINNNSRGMLVLWADADAAVTTAPIRLVATARVGEHEIRREVRPYTRVWGDLGSSRPTRSLVLGVREQAPFGVRIEPHRLTGKAGETVELKVVATRLKEGFNDPITLAPVGFPGNFQMQQVDIPGDKSEILLKIQIQNGTRPGPYSLALQARAQVNYARDDKMPNPPKMLVTTISQPVTIDVEKGQ